MTTTKYNNIINEMIYTALSYQSRGELLNIKLAPVWLVKDKQSREVAEDVITNMISNAAINTTSDNKFIIPDDTFISALDGYLLPVSSATKTLKEADVLGYCQTDIDIIADALQDK